MDFLLSGLRRGWRALGRKLVPGPVRSDDGTELTVERRAALLLDLADRQARLTQELVQARQDLWKALYQQRQQLAALDQVPALERLRLLYPWPARRPAVAPSARGWDGGGRDIVTRRLVERSAKVVLEVGAFLGLSTRTWLSAVPGATVICIDPWYDHYDDDSGFRHWPDVVGKNIYHLFLSSCWEFRDRIIPVRGLSPISLEVVAEFGARPDLIYIDGAHEYGPVTTDLEAAHRLFPNAILTGDDWLWDGDPNKPRAVRAAVEDFAAARGWRVEASGNTWALDR